MPVPPNADEIGAWSDVFSWPLIGLHTSLTSDGKILTFGTDLNGQQSGLHIYDVWDPVTNTHTTLSHTTNSDLFCAVAMINSFTGQLLIAGGDGRPVGNYNDGIPDVNTFNPADLSLTQSATGPMAFSRWYASAVSLASGQIVMLGGRNDGTPASPGPVGPVPGVYYSPYPEIYTSGYGFRTLTGAYIDTFNLASLYPRSWLNSEGKIITFGDASNDIYVIDPSGSGSVELVGQQPTAIGWYQASIMFAPDMALLIGNDGTAWIMDISGPIPTFQQTADAGADRVWANLTVLPDGRVMISGGSAVYNELQGVNNTVEIWDPDTGLWSVEGDAAVAQLYHATTILLADGTVLSLGGGAPGPLANLNGEIYSPDYLFDAGAVAAPRPVITEAPESLDVGQDFTIEVSNPASIETLALMQFGTVTHSFNMAAQRIELTFQVQPDGSLLVDLPDNANVLTPGYWMLFAIDATGTPSIAATIQIHSDIAPYVPQEISLQLGDLGFALKANGTATYDGFDDTYVLTPDAQIKAGSLMSEQRVDLTQAFDITFSINLGADDTGADGMAFVLHNDAAGGDALGVAGGGMGALGIGAGLAIEFDTFQNLDVPTDLANDHTNFVDTDSGAVLSPATDLGNIEDGAWHSVRVTWDGETLTYFVDGVAIATLNEDIAANYLGGEQFAYLGFSAGTGGLTEQTKVRIEKVDATLEDGTVVHADRAELPEQPTFVTSGDASANTGLHSFTVTPNAPLQLGSVMLDERIDLGQAFNLRFQINLGANDDGADGMAFVLHNDPLGAAATGAMGGGMGAVGLANSLTIEFDTYQNADAPLDLVNDHTSFVDADGPSESASVSPVVDLGNIEDGAWHTVQVSWDGQTLSYTFDGVLAGTLTEDIIANYFGGSQFAYLGFTGATGGGSEHEQVRIIRFDATAEDGTKLHLLGPNTAPVTADDQYSVAANGTLVVAAAGGVLANDADPEGDALHICDEPRMQNHAPMLTPRNGTVVMNEDGSFSYTPNAGFVGVDKFDYCIDDEWACCAGTVTITVTGGESQAATFVVNGDASEGAAAHTFTVMPDVQIQSGSVTSQDRISLAAAFSLGFQIHLGADDGGADGMAFVLHNDPLGAAAIGAIGGGMGVVGIANSLAIEFDTYQNAGAPLDLVNDHTSFIDADGPSESASVSPVVDLGNIEDGAWHTVQVTWDGQTLSYTFDGVLAGTLTEDIIAAYFGGSEFVHFGFTGATGGGTEQGQVRLLSLEATAENGTSLSLEGSGPGQNMLVGDAGNNVIVGTGGVDVLLGLGGEDTLDGAAGNDILSGGTGNNSLTAGAGNDTFVFAPGFGVDTITDFGDGVPGNIDLIDFTAFGYTSAQEVLVHATGNTFEAVGDTYFDFGNGDLLIVENTSAGYVTNLTAADFIV